MSCFLSRKKKQFLAANISLPDYFRAYFFASLLVYERALVLIALILVYTNSKQDLPGPKYKD